MGPAGVVVAAAAAGTGEPPSSGSGSVALVLREIRDGKSLLEATLICASSARAVRL